MSWRIEIKPSAEKQYLKLDRTTRQRIKCALRDLEGEERPLLHTRVRPLTGRLKAVALHPGQGLEGTPRLRDSAPGRRVLTLETTAEPRSGAKRSSSRLRSGTHLLGFGEPPAIERRAEAVPCPTLTQHRQHVLQSFIVLTKDPVAILAHHRQPMKYDGLPRAQHDPQATSVEGRGQLEVGVLLRHLCSRLRPGGAAVRARWRPR